MQSGKQLARLERGWRRREELPSIAGDCKKTGSERGE